MTGVSAPASPASRYNEGPQYSEAQEQPGSAIEEMAKENYLAISDAPVPGDDIAEKVAEVPSPDLEEIHNSEQMLSNEKNVTYMQR